MVGGRGACGSVELCHDLEGVGCSGFGGGGGGGVVGGAFLLYQTPLKQPLKSHFAAEWRE